jgi:WhiB family transcriptional regulator, redox-sensing transcriptional regulator
MDQGLRRRITLPVVGRVGPPGSNGTAAPVTGRIWRLEGWRNSASCRDSDPDLFYPLGRGRAAFEQAEVAKAVCRDCPSREPCLAYALVTRQDLGVWGGTSPEDRRVLIRGQRPAVAS